MRSTQSRLAQNQRTTPPRPQRPTALDVHGRVLTGEAFEDHARRQGLCPRCGETRTHVRVRSGLGLTSKLKPVTITNSSGGFDIYKGYCLGPRCYLVNEVKEILNEPITYKRKERLSSQSSNKSHLSQRTPDTSFSSETESHDSQDYVYQEFLKKGDRAHLLSRCVKETATWSKSSKNATSPPVDPAWDANFIAPSGWNKKQSPSESQRRVPPPHSHSPLPTCLNKQVTIHMGEGEDDLSFSQPASTQSFPLGVAEQWLSGSTLRSESHEKSTRRCMLNQGLSHDSALQSVRLPTKVSKKDIAVTPHTKDEFFPSQKSKLMTEETLSHRNSTTAMRYATGPVDLDEPVGPVDLDEVSENNGPVDVDEDPVGPVDLDEIDDFLSESPSRLKPIVESTSKNLSKANPDPEEVVVSLTNSVKAALLLRTESCSSSSSWRSNEHSYDHAIRAGALWFTIVGQHVRFPISWFDGARSPQMGVSNQLLDNKVPRYRWIYVAKDELFAEDLLRAFVPTTMSPGRILLHLIIRDDATGGAVEDVAIGCYHPCFHNTSFYAEDDARVVWMALRRRSDYYEGSTSRIDSIMMNGQRFSEISMESPLGNDGYLQNNRLNAVFGDKPPAETVFVLESALIKRINAERGEGYVSDLKPISLLLLEMYMQRRVEV